MIEWRIVVAAVILGNTGVAFADDVEPAAECTAISDDATRLACYDRVFGLDTAEITPAPTGPMTMDDIGEETAPAKEQKVDVRAVGHVTRCERNAAKKYLFYFENGQIWKQVSDKRLFFKDCDFDVTVSRDMFGYKMQIDGKKSKTRISRIR